MPRPRAHPDEPDPMLSYPLRMPAVMRDDLDAHADRYGLDRATVARIAIRAGLATPGIEETLREIARAAGRLPEQQIAVHE